MNKDMNEELKREVTENIGNVSMNFRHFEFKTYSQEEKRHVFKFPFQKYRSFDRGTACVFYKHISRIIKR